MAAQAVQQFHQDCHLVHLVGRRQNHHVRRIVVGVMRMQLQPSAGLRKELDGHQGFQSRQPNRR